MSTKAIYENTKCIICLENSDCFQLMETTIVNNKLVLEMYKSFTKIEFNANEFNTKICSICLSNLINAYNFQKKCLKAYKQLLSIKEKLSIQINFNPGTSDILSTNLMKPKEDIILPSKVESDETSDNVLTGNINKINNKKVWKQLNTQLSNKTCESESDGTNTEENFTCTKCFQIFNIPSNLMNIHKKPYECNNCKQIFSCNSNLTDNKELQNCITKSKTIENQFETKCYETYKKIPKQKSFAPNMNTFENLLNKKTYLCEFCPKIFSKYNLLKKHIKSHMEMDKIFSLSSHLNLHNGIKPHICHICNKGFSQLCTLKDHLRIHTGERPFLCPNCGKAFNNNSNLRQHMIRHIGDKNFSCAECSAAFASKGGLKSHMAVHYPLKPYTCDICNKTFTKNYSLSKHKRIHTEEKPFKCDVCPKKFYSSYHLTRHLRTHTGEKPYKCKRCGNSFAQSNDLVKHTRTHIGEKTYQCQECDLAFRLKVELRLHLQEHFRHKKALIEHENSTVH